MKNYQKYEPIKGFRSLEKLRSRNQKLVYVYKALSYV